MNEMRQESEAPRAVLLCSAAFFCVCICFTALLQFGLWRAFLWCGVGAFLFGALLLLLCQGRYMAVTVGLLLGFLCCGAHGYFAWRPAQSLSGVSGECRVMLTDYARGYDGWGIGWGKLCAVDGKPAAHRVKIYLQDGSPDYAPGDLLVFDGKLRAASSKIDDGLLQRGVFMTVRQSGPISCEENGAATVLTKMRRLSGMIRTRIGRMLTGDEGGLLSGMLTGDEEGCSSAFIAALNAVGMRHITAVSGLHLSILAGFLIRVLGKRAGVWLALPTVFTFAAIAGFPASAMRAAVMQGFVLAAFLLKRENDSPTALGAALLLLCAINPFSALSASLQLSCSATAGILWIYPGLARRLRPKPLHNKVLHALCRYGIDTVAVSLSVTVCTLPIMLFWFNSVSLISVPMNLLTLWAVSLSLLLGIVALCLTMLIPAAAPAAGWVLQWPLRYVTACIRAGGRLPFASAQGSLYLSCGTAVLLFILLLLRRGYKRMLPFGALILCLCFVLSALENRMTTAVECYGTDGAVILALHSGKEMAFIGGGASDAISESYIREAMSRYGNSESRFLLSSAKDWRQTGGLRGAAEAAHAAQILLPAGTALDKDDSTEILWYTEGGTVALGNLTVTLLPAGPGYCVYISGAGMTLLSVCGTEPWDALSALAEHPCRAQMLVIDSKWAASSAALTRTCALTGAQILLYSDDYWNYAPQRLCGHPVVALSEAKTVTLKTMR